MQLSGLGLIIRARPRHGRQPFLKRDRLGAFERQITSAQPASTVQLRQLNGYPLH